MFSIQEVVLDEKDNVIEYREYRQSKLNHIKSPIRNYRFPIPLRLNYQLQQ